MQTHLQLSEPHLGELRDDSCASVRCIVSRSARHSARGLLTARAAARVWCGGGSREGSRDVRGRVSAYATATGALVGSVQLEAHATCLALVETVRPTAPLRSTAPRKTPEGFGCELFLWVGQADGRIAVLSAHDLQIRVVLPGHRGALACVATPGAPPSSPSQGAAIVLSSAEDWGLRLWDARKTECLRSIPGGSAVLRAVLPVWTPEGERPERCRVWSAADDSTMCVWEPRLSGGGGTTKGQGAPPHTVALPAACLQLAASSDGRLVAAAAGAEGVFVFDGNVRLRARLRAPPDGGAGGGGGGGGGVVAVLVVGRGRQLWGACKAGGLVLWQRAAAAAPGAQPDWSWSCVRRHGHRGIWRLGSAAAGQHGLSRRHPMAGGRPPHPGGEGGEAQHLTCHREAPHMPSRQSGRPKLTFSSRARLTVQVQRLRCAPLAGLCAAGPAQVWGGARDGSVQVWLSEAAAADATEALARRVLLGGSDNGGGHGGSGGGGGGAGGGTLTTTGGAGGGSGGGGGGGGTGTGTGLVYPLLRLLRHALRELHGVREFLTATHAQVRAWTEEGGGRWDMGGPHWRPTGASHTAASHDAASHDAARLPATTQPARPVGHHDASHHVIRRHPHPHPHPHPHARR